MATRNVPVGSSWVAVAGAGWATVTSHFPRGGWPLSWAVGPTEPAGSLKGHILPDGTDRSYQIEGSDKLWLRGETGAETRTVAVTSETLPD